MTDLTSVLYDAKIAEWKKADDITKAKNLDGYLVTLNPSDKSAGNLDRNAQYKERAIFYAIAGQTLRGMVGSIFRKWPQITVPDELMYLQSDADGSGVSIYQQSQAVTSDVLSKGFAGLAVSFPVTDGDISVENQSLVTAKINRFEPEQIINWREEGGRIVLVVLSETESVLADDAYDVEMIDVLRELSLEDGVYVERKWAKDNDGKYQVVSEIFPTDSTGAGWDVIPFVFVGSSDNDSIPDDAPLKPLIDINIGHYRNSADLEDSCWFCGQAQPYMSGLTQDYIDMLKANNMYVGSRSLIGVPSGETFGFAQANPNPLVRQLMIDKVEMMISMGARLMQPGSATKTATQAAGDIEAQTSALALVASNVSEAYTKALGYVARYMGVNADDLSYTLNQDFINSIADANMLREVVASFVSGAMPVGDYTRYMRKAELFTDDKSDEDYADMLRMANGGQ